MCRENVWGVQGMLVRENLLRTDAKITQEFSVRCSDMQFQVTPAVPDISAIGVRAVESEENESLLHHLLCLKNYRQLRIFENDGFRRE